MEGHDPGMPDGIVRKNISSESGRFDPEAVITNRSGDVLIKNTVLKADHFPSCHNTKLTPILEGAPNFRKVEGLRVFGVAIPTATGLRRVVNTMGAQGGKRWVYWQNLREEPLIFINGNPFVVREADQPFANLEYTGIDRKRVEDMELRLKMDILAEAKAFGNRILVVHENEDLSLFDHWEPVTSEDVQTPQEVYDELTADGYKMDYLRVPVTDEKAPKDEDFEELICRLWGIPDDAGVVFNCQMGRGRTTSGMVIASLLYLRKMGAFPLRSGKSEAQGSVPEWFKATAAARQTVPKDDSEQLKGGMYGVVRSLLRALERGPEAKMVLDAVIDACGAMQNLREGIFSYRTRFLKEAREKQRDKLLHVCLEYLERYYMLLAFTGYLASPQFKPGLPGHVSFPEWMAQRPELRSILLRLLRRNSMAALELHQRMVPGVNEEETSNDGFGKENGPKLDKDVVATRTGAVLGPFTILKEDNFPGMQSSKIGQVIEGAPNFRGMPGMPIYGVGMPTVEGVRGVLQDVCGSSSKDNGQRVYALWVNMREEPVVYINGKPFVLREEVRPLKNMVEYAGIDAGRLEAMEERLKKDVLSEALRHAGHVLVAHESFEMGHYGELYDTWEVIDHPDNVQTPAELYSGLAHEGLGMKYLRLPVTDGTAPTANDFDAITTAMMEWGRDDPVIFNCQMGIGRATTGMVVASLVHMYFMKALETARSAPHALEELFRADVKGLQGYIAAGFSPRMNEEGDDVDEFGGDDEDEEPKLKEWDLNAEEMEEQRSLASGGYVGVRRVARLLEEGDSSKRTLDAVVDLASALMNLRVSIMKYRKPRASYKYIRPELQQRASAFKKGIAYLERYCKLIAFAYYLEHVGPGCSFGEWVISRPDLQAALAAIHQNPGAALAPLPVPIQPMVLVGDAGEASNMAQVQKEVLKKRRGRLLNRRTILKSYLFHEAKGQPELEAAATPDLRRTDVEGQTIVSCGGATLAGLRALLCCLGAGPGGSKHIVIADLREELVVYINGVPYTRRELEMPVAALHHAGVHATQLEEQELMLLEDVAGEVTKYSGKLLLHKEVGIAPADYGSEEDAASHVTPSAAGAAGARAEPAQGQEDKQGPIDPADAILEAYRNVEMSAKKPSNAEIEPNQSTVMAVPFSKSQRVNTSVGLDMTAPVDACPGAQVAAFWEDIDRSSPQSLMTPGQLINHLVQVEGFRASYKRIPLSRERTPEAQDLDEVHAQTLDAHRIHVPEELAFTEDSPLVHLIVSRTATGSSARFVASALAAFYSKPITSHPSRSSISTLETGLSRSSLGGARSSRGLDRSSSRAQSLDSGSGEFRGIMALCRLLPGGFEAKLTVDRATARVHAIGDLLGDIRRCKAIAESLPIAQPSEDPLAVVYSSHSAARQLGLHYLKRYFLLIVYRCFLEAQGHSKYDFSSWMRQQKELGHLFAQLACEV